MKAKAVFVTRDTGHTSVEVWDPKKGIKKLNGCICYLAEDSAAARTRLNEPECREEYGDYIDEGEAWLVQPIKEGELRWLWTHIDPDMALLTMGEDRLPGERGVKVMKI